MSDAKAQTVHTVLLAWNSRICRTMLQWWESDRRLLLRWRMDWKVAQGAFLWQWEHCASWLEVARSHKHACSSQHSQQCTEEHVAVCELKIQLQKIIWDALFVKSQTKESLELGSRKRPGGVMWSHPSCRWKAPKEKWHAHSHWDFVVEAGQERKTLPGRRVGAISWECWQSRPPCTLLALNDQFIGPWTLVSLAYPSALGPFTAFLTVLHLGGWFPRPCLHEGQCGARLAINRKNQSCIVSEYRNSGFSVLLRWLEHL